MSQLLTLISKYLNFIEFCGVSYFYLLQSLNLFRTGLEDVITVIVVVMDFEYNIVTRKSL